MSVLGQFPTRLQWDGRKGVARHDGVEVQLSMRPEGMLWRQVDYAPDAVATCRDRDCDPERDLLPDEVGMIRTYLAQMARRARS